MNLLIEISEETLKASNIDLKDVTFVAEDTGNIAEITATFALINQAKKDIGQLYKQLDALWTKETK